MTRRRILLVEDNPDDATLTTRAFETTEPGVEMVVVDNAEDALHYLFRTGRYASRDVQSVPGLLLLDLNLIRMGGFEVLRTVRANPLTRHLPIVVMSSSNEPLDIRMSYDLGANSFIRKPVRFTQLTEVARQIVAYWLALNESADP